MRLRIFTFIILIALTTACDDGAPSPAAPSSTMNPLSPSGFSASPATPSAVSNGAAAAVKGRDERLVTIQDACDPDTFNAALGPGTCVRAGGVRFEDFLTLLSKHGSVGAWHFAPPNTTIQLGQTFVAINRGGEVHTFTEVDAFGGGIVPRLNELTGISGVAKECTTLEEDDFVPSGGTYREEVDQSGTVKFQCCIHPWMRLEAKVSER